MGRDRARDGDRSQLSGAEKRGLRLDKEPREEK